jgi:hypothetical protein
MPCKQSELVSAINSYAAARSTNDGNLINMSGSILQNLLGKIEFEEEETTQTEVVEDSE